MRLIDLLLYYGAEELRLEYFQHGMLYGFSVVPLDWTLRQAAEAVGGSIMLVLKRRTWC